MNERSSQPLFMVGVDGSEPSLRAVGFAIELAQRQDNARLLVVNVVDWPTGMMFPEAAPVVPALDAEWFERAEHDMLASARQKILAPALEQIEAAGIRVDSEIAFGAPAQEIVALAEDRAATGIVVGRSGHKGLRRPIFGGVASSLLQSAQCPVYIVP